MNNETAKPTQVFKIPWVKLFPETSTPQNGQTHSNSSLRTADELFECVWQFWGVGA